ncbi:MAG: DNRLRE domain-containing protein [Minicystis sp.]
MTRCAARALGPALALLGALSGCVQETPGPEPEGDAIPAAIGEARQALGAPVCARIARPAGQVADTQIANKLPPKSYGASGTFNTGIIDGEERQTLLRFDVSGIQTLPNTVVVASSATVTLAEGHSAPTGPATINVHRVTAPWSEATVTWQSFGGAFAPAVEASFGNTGPTMTFSIPALVEGWANGTFPNNGVLLEQPGPYGTNFWSSEYDATQGPALDLCYTLACKAGFADCNGVQADGCEVDTASDVHDCGGCGVACSVPHATPVCNGGACALAACDPGYYDCDGDPQNGCEPAPCASGSHCQVDADCQSGQCTNGLCAAPSCTDLAQNGGETDIDCGGSTACPRCQAGQRCVVDGDCASGPCQNGVCSAPPTIPCASSGGSVDSQGRCVFDPGATCQTVTMPAAAMIKLNLWGGGGGGNGTTGSGGYTILPAGYGLGGGGAAAVAFVPVKAGDVLKLCVGKGGDGTMWGGTRIGGTGGGATYVEKNGVLVVLAGGGGGGGNGGTWTNTAVTCSTCLAPVGSPCTGGGYIYEGNAQSATDQTTGLTGLGSAGFLLCRPQRCWLRGREQRRHRHRRQGQPHGYLRGRQRRRRLHRRHRRQVPSRDQPRHRRGHGLRRRRRRLLRGAGLRDHPSSGQRQRQLRHRELPLHGGRQRQRRRRLGRARPDAQAQLLLLHRRGRECMEQQQRVLPFGRWHLLVQQLPLQQWWSHLRGQLLRGRRQWWLRLQRRRLPQHDGRRTGPYRVERPAGAGNSGAGDAGAARRQGR